MEKIVIISDIHGNLPAIEAVLEDIRMQSIDKIICLGDMVGKGPNSAEVIDICRRECDVIVLGNWDRYLANMSTYVILEGELDNTNISNFSVQFQRVVYNIKLAIEQARNSSLPTSEIYI